MHRIAFVVAAGLVLMACAGDPDLTGTTAPTEPQRTETEAAPSEGGTLVAAISADPGSLNPAITTSGGVHTASELMFNGMVELDRAGTPTPSLAASWDIEEDGALYRFHLVEGVTWHDGEPFTAADVVFSFEEVLLEFHSRTAASVGTSIEAIEAIDDLTVEFRFQAPYAPFLQQLGVTEAPIVPRHIYEGTDPLENPANLEPIGTGPFMFVSYTPDSEIRLVRNDNYFKPGLPILDEVVLRIIPDDSTAVAALERGEVDFVFGVPGPERERLLASGDYASLQTSVNPGGANCIMTISFNLDREILQDVRTRRAIALGLNKDEFVERITFGQGKAAAAPISSGIPFAHDPSVDLPGFDRDAAAALLDEVGWVRDGDGVRTASGVPGVADGTSLAFEFLSFPGFSAYGDLVRAQLMELGVEVTTRTEDPPVFAVTVFTDREFDTNIISFCNGPDPEIGVSRMYLSENIRPVPFTNSSAYRNEQVDALFAEAGRTVDPDDRAVLYSQISEILAEEMPYIWMVETLAERVFTNRCTDFGESGHFAETARCTQ